MKSNLAEKSRDTLVEAAAELGSLPKAKGGKAGAKGTAERVEIYMAYFRVERGVTTILCSSMLKYHEFTVDHHHLRRAPREAVDYLLENYEFDSPTTIYVQTKKLFQHITRQARNMPRFKLSLCPLNRSGSVPLISWKKSIMRKRYSA